MDPGAKHLQRHIIVFSSRDDVTATDLSIRCGAPFFEQLLLVGCIGFDRLQVLFLRLGLLGFEGEVPNLIATRSRDRFEIINLFGKDDHRDQRKFVIF